MKTKRVITTVVMALLIGIGVKAQETYVLVTGVSSYQDSRNDVTLTTKNAKSFAQKMLTQTDNVSILTSKYANHDNVLEKLKIICSKAKEDDRIVFLQVMELLTIFKMVAFVHMMDQYTILNL